IASLAHERGLREAEKPIPHLGSCLITLYQAWASARAPAWASSFCITGARCGMPRRPKCVRGVILGRCGDGFRGGGAAAADATAVGEDGGCLPTPAARRERL